MRFLRLLNLHESGSFVIKPITKADLPEIYNLCGKVFAKVCPPKETADILSMYTNWPLSRKCVDQSGQLIGVYCLNDISIIYTMHRCIKIYDKDWMNYIDKKGIQGVALAVKPEFRNTGAGRLLRSVPENMGYDFVWGCQDKTIGNLPNWLKAGRRLIGETKDSYVTIKDLK